MSRDGSGYKKGSYAGITGQLGLRQSTVVTASM